MKIIIPSDTARLADRCLASIKQADPQFLKSTYIVTGKPDELDYLGDKYGCYVIERSEPVFVYAQAINDGLESSPDDDALLLNDDAEIETEGGLSALRELVERVGNKVGVISAGIKGVAGVPEQQAGSGATFRLADSVSFVAAVISLPCMASVGILDDDFVGYGWEDNDYCYRASQAGFQVAVYDGCLVSHRHPHTTFERSVDVGSIHWLGELIFRRKHNTLIGEPVFVVGPTNCGASVVAAAIGGLGIAMSDPHPAHVKATTQYYRDPLLSHLARLGPEGIELYGLRRSEDEARWGARIWPSHTGLKNILHALPDARIVFVARDMKSAIKSHALDVNVAEMEVRGRIEREFDDLERCMELCTSMGIPYHIVSFDDMISHAQEVISELARFLGHEASIAGALQEIHPELITFGQDGQMVQRPKPEGFGKIAVGVRCSNPMPSFVGCLAMMMKQGLREGDIMLEPSYRSPSHIAANNLIRAFLNTDADTLLLVDDDMTFSDTLLEEMRTNEESWGYGVVSALATQRVVPPRAIVMRESEQPGLPDSLAGIYYTLMKDEVEPGLVLRVDATGFAFTLIRREVFEAMTNEHGPLYTHYVQWGEGGMGEDVWFCRRVRDLGYGIAVDTSAHVGHIGSIVYGYDEFDQWRSQSRSGAGVSVAALGEIVAGSIETIDEDRVQDALSFLSKTRGIR